MFHFATSMQTRQTRFRLLLITALLLAAAALLPTTSQAQVAQVTRRVSIGFQTDNCHWLVINGTYLTFRIPQTWPGLARSGFNPTQYVEWNACTGSVYQPVLVNSGMWATTVNSGRNYNFSGGLNFDHRGGLGLQILFTGRFNIRTQAVEIPTATAFFYVTADPSMRVELEPINTIVSWY